MGFKLIFQKFKLTRNIPYNDIRRHKLSQFSAISDLLIFTLFFCGDADKQTNEHSNKQRKEIVALSPEGRCVAYPVGV